MNPSTKPYEYKYHHLERDFVSGAFRGSIVGFSYGIFYGAYHNYDPALN